MLRIVLKLSTFVAVCIGFTLWLAFTIGNIHPLRDTYTLSAAFDDVTGLLRDDNVKVAGVVVGKVTGISVEQGRARVRFEVEHGVDIPRDSTAVIRWRNLLGQRYVYLEPGTDRAVLRHGGEVTQTRSVVDLGELFNRLGPVVQAIDPQQVNRFLDTMVAALSGNEDQLAQAIDDLALLAQALGERDAAIGRLVENLDTVSGALVARDEQIRTMLDNLVLLATTFNQHTDVLDAAVTDLGDFSAHLDQLLGENRAEVDRIVTNLTEVVAVVESRLEELDATVAGLDEFSAALFAISRHGEWLNQVIPCGAGTAPDGSRVDVPCTTTGDVQGAQGAAALRRLLAPPMPEAMPMEGRP